MALISILYLKEKQSHCNITHRFRLCILNHQHLYYGCFHDDFSESQDCLYLDQMVDC